MMPMSTFLSQNLTGIPVTGVSTSQPIFSTNARRDFYLKIFFKSQLTLPSLLKTFCLQNLHDKGQMFQCIMQGYSLSVSAVLKLSSQDSFIQLKIIENGKGSCLREPLSTDIYYIRN